MNKVMKGLGVVGLMGAPFLAMAQEVEVVGGTLGGQETGGNSIFDILGTISAIFGIVIPILITLAVLYTIWGVIKYATAKEAEDQAEGRRVIISGLIGLFVIVSIWGLVAVINTTFGIDQGGSNLQSTGCAAGTIIGYDTDTNEAVYCDVLGSGL